MSPAELVDEAINRIEMHDARINAVVLKMYDQARQTASGHLPDGPFTGVPFLQKDMYDPVAGVPMSCGTRLLSEVIQSSDCEMTARYRAAGLVLVGKTSLPELSLTPSCESDLFGATANPWDVDRTPGGSSGGSAASVAAGYVPIASGEDGGGSIRIPASCCGVFGLKPTRGRTPTGPSVGDVWRGFCQGNVITRSVRDSAAMLDSLIGPEVGSPYVTAPPERPYLQEVTTEPGNLRVARVRSSLLGRDLHPDCLTALDEAVELLEGLGHSIVDVRPPVDGEAFGLAFLTMVACETRATVGWVASVAGSRLSLRDFEPTTAGLALLGEAFSGGDYAAALNHLMAAARDVGRFFEGFDVLLTPTLPEPPPLTGFLQPSMAERFAARLIDRLKAPWLLRALGVAKPLSAKTLGFCDYNPVFNVTGQPAMSVPLCWSVAGLPIGMEFVGRFGDEVTLFRLAGQLERVQPWFDRLPPAVT
ncbi:MAG: amidase [Thermoleophilia bacterium]